MWNLRDILIILLGLTIQSQATFDAIDYSNLDLLNFQYFKNFPKIDYTRASLVEPINQHFQRKVAVFNYMRNLLIGNPNYDQQTNIVFDPNFGKAWQDWFQANYGYRGEKLVELLGRGISPKLLKYYTTLPKDFGL